MHCKTRENWPFSGLFFVFRVILTSGGYLLKITSTDLLGGRLGYFLLFCSGERKGESGATGRVWGVGFSLQIPGRGEGVCRKFGAGTNYLRLFWGPKCPPSLALRFSRLTATLPCPI